MICMYSVGILAQVCPLRIRRCMALAKWKKSYTKLASRKCDQNKSVYPLKDQEPQKQATMA